MGKRWWTVGARHAWQAVRWVDYGAARAPDVSGACWLLTWLGVTWAVMWLMGR